MANHLWYLSEELAVLALFDRSLTVHVKRKTVSALTEESQDNPLP